MAVVYVKEQRSVIRKRGARLLVEKDEETLAEIRVRETDAVAVFGNVQVTTQALGMLLDEGIPVALYTLHGRLKGHLVPEASKNLPLRVAQYRAALDEAASLGPAREVVQAKIANTRAVAALYRTNYPNGDLAEAVEELTRLEGRAAEAGDRAELLGLEGAAAARWFAVFGKLNRSGLPFPGRRMHPSPDPVNALLSFGYTVLGNEIRALAEGAGLEPHLGFLHQVDRLTLRLVNQSVLREEDFGRSLAGRNEGRIVLNPGSLARYLGSYEEAVTAARKGAPEGIRAELARDVEKLKRWLAGGEMFRAWREEEADAVPGEL